MELNYEEIIYSLMELVQRGVEAGIYFSDEIMSYDEIVNQMWILSELGKREN